jgi:two-component system, LytTR family, sensor kinase
LNHATPELAKASIPVSYLLWIFFLFSLIADVYPLYPRSPKVELEKITAEMNFLKAQLNPHFLFNTLNNLYGLILEKSDKSAESVLKLADIMKYILSEGKEEKVSLEKEITLIQNYTELERLRKTDAAITFTKTGHINGQLITPLLLLPFIENAFTNDTNYTNKYN